MSDQANDQVPNRALPPVRHVSNPVSTGYALAESLNRGSSHVRTTPAPPVKKTVVPEAEVLTLGQLRSRVRDTDDTEEAEWSPGKLLRETQANRPRQLGASLAASALGRMRR